ncbi:MAG: hypothetical protein ACKV19_20090 [Verrucomicrobiales bacterium]
MACSRKTGFFESLVPEDRTPESRTSGAKDGWTKLTSHRVGGKAVFRLLGIVLVLVLEVAAALTALPPTPVTLPVHQATPVSR